MLKRSTRPLFANVLACFVAWMVVFETLESSRAQPATIPTTDTTSISELADAAKAPRPTVDAAPPTMDLVSLLIKGGIFMIPIGLISLIAAAFAIERLIGLRSGRLLPSVLVKKVGAMLRESESIDPRIAYPICLEHPSAASNVVRAVLLRAGRPLSELESVAAETTQREADKAYAGVRWLNLAAGLAPLLGLLGTVWGLIQAFHDMTMLTPSQNRAEYLGRGIYIALVTTLAGLTVAIPASFISHWFEGRIQRYFSRIEELLFAIIPKLERYEGRIRFEAIGRELVAKSVDPTKKVVSSGDAAKAPAAPPVQTVTFGPTGNATVNPSGTPHTPASSRKTLYKP